PPRRLRRGGGAAVRLPEAGDRQGPEEAAAARRGGVGRTVRHAVPVGLLIDGGHIGRSSRAAFSAAAASLSTIAVSTSRRVATRSAPQRSATRRSYSASHP